MTREDPTGGIAVSMISAVHDLRSDGAEDECPSPGCDRNGLHEEDTRIRIRETMWYMASRVGRDWSGAMEKPLGDTSDKGLGTKGLFLMR